MTTNQTGAAHYLDEAEAAAFIERPVPTLRRWRVERKNLPFYRHGGVVRYREADLVAFLENGRIEPKAEVALRHVGRVQL